MRKDYILHNSNHMTFWKCQNCGGSKKVSGFQGLRRGKGWIGGAWKIFSAVKYSVGYCNGGYVSLYICPNPRNVQQLEWILRKTMDFGLWGCVSCKLLQTIVVPRVPPCLGIVIMRQALLVWGLEVCGKPLHFPLNFVMNLNCSKQIKSLKRKEKCCKHLEAEAMTFLDFVGSSRINHPR